MKPLTLAIILTVTLTVVSGLIADVPNLINYQGTLTDSTGNPIDGTRSMRFYLYDDSTGGSDIWSEQQNDVPINDGFFQVILGSSNPIPHTIFDGTTKWFTSMIEPEVIQLSPRQPLVTVPYSFKTMKSDSADYATYAYFADYSDQANQALEADLATEATHAIYADTADYSLMSAPDGDWTISGNTIYHMTGDVGIGTVPITGIR